MAALWNPTEKTLVHILLLSSMVPAVTAQDIDFNRELGEAYANVVANSLHPSLDRCENFYGYACKIVNSSKMDSFRSWGIDYLDSLVEKALKEADRLYTDREKSKIVPDSMAQMLKVYKSCKDRHKIAEKIVESKGYHDFMRDSGLNQTKLSEKRSAFSIIVRLSLVWGIETPLLNFEIKPGLPANPERIVIQGNRIPGQRSPRMFAMNPSPFADIETEMKSLRRKLLETVKVHQKRVDIPVPDKFLDLFQRYYAVDAFIRDISSSTQYFAKVKDFYSGTFQSLESDHNLDWATALNYNLRPFLHITPETRVEVQNLGFAMALAELSMDPRFELLFNGYVVSWYLMNLAKNIGGEIEKTVCKLPGMKCETDERFCIRQTRMLLPGSYNGVVLRFFMPSRAAGALVMNVAVTQAHLAQLIKESEWVPQKSKAMMIHKILSMMVYVFQPSHLNDLRGTEHRMVPRRFFFLNILHIKKSTAEYRLTSFYRKYTRGAYIWGIVDPPTTPEPKYDPYLNAIIVPSTFGMFPHCADLGDFLPGIISSASMTLGIGKALARAFDIGNGAFDQWGNSFELGGAWQGTVTSIMMMKTNCYEKMFAENVVIDGKEVSYAETQSSDEIQADAIAFELLQHGREYWKAQADLPVIVMEKIQQLTADQLSYVAATLPYCTRQNSKSVSESVDHGLPLEGLRFNKFLSTISDFQSTFNCKPREQRCSFFLS